MCLIVVALLALRVIYLVFLSPYELVGDEAHYWEWSRRPDLSYYSKGPGVAWTILASTSILGHSEWAIRLPAALASALTALALMWLTRLLCPEHPTAPFYTAAAFILSPVYVALAQLMTIDGPWVLCWVLAACCFQRLCHSQRRLLPWIGFAAAMGVGVLYKYTMLLFLPGALAYVIVHRRALAWKRRDRVLGVLALATFVATTLPVAIWNHRHGYPTITHLIGRLYLPGGDEPAVFDWTPTWFLEYAGAQVGMFGVFLLVLMALGVYHFGAEQRSILYMSLPIILFYLVLSVFRRTQGNWAVAGYATLLPMAGRLVAMEYPRYTQMVRDWRLLPEPRPKCGLFRRRPETLVSGLWDWSVAVGVGAMVVVMAGPWVLELVGEPAARLRGRIRGHRELATQVDAAAQQLRAQGEDPFFVALSYRTAGLLAFYLPGQPVVRCAQTPLGMRRNQYDYFPDARFDDPALTGRVAVLQGASPKRWREVFHFERIEEVNPQRRISIGWGYQPLEKPTNPSAANASHP